MIPTGVKSSSEWAIEMFNLSAGRPARTFGSVPTKRGALQMTSASSLSPKSVVSVRLARSLHELPPVTYADSCTLVHYDNDVSPGFYYYESEGSALNIHDITGSAQSRIIQCLKVTKPLAGFDQDMTRFEELADTPTPKGTTREASGAELPHDDGRLSTIYEESEADPESHVMEV
eukprot:6555420-Pyramimonas_sp.AAC.1